jgi:hypothetical protein
VGKSIVIPLFITPACKLPLASLMYKKVHFAPLRLFSATGNLKLKRLYDASKAPLSPRSKYAYFAFKLISGVV